MAAVVAMTSSAFPTIAPTALAKASTSVRCATHTRTVVLIRPASELPENFITSAVNCGNLTSPVKAISIAFRIFSAGMEA